MSCDVHVSVFRVFSATVRPYSLRMAPHTIELHTYTKRMTPHTWSSALIPREWHPTLETPHLFPENDTPHYWNSTLIPREWHPTLLKLHTYSQRMTPHTWSFTLIPREWHPTLLKLHTIVSFLLVGASIKLYEYFTEQARMQFLMNLNL